MLVLLFCILDYLENLWYMYFILFTIFGVIYVYFTDDDLIVLELDPPNAL